LSKLLKTWGPHETNPRKIWRVDAHENVNGSDKAAGPPPDNTGPVKDTGKRRLLVIGAYVAAAAAFTAVGFGATSVIRDQLGSASAASAIPTPPPANQTFVEDDDGTGADSQEDILQSTVPGLARITSAHGSGSGIVLTRSGLLLTSSQIVSGGAITVRVLPSGHAYRATVTGSNPAHGLALLQIQGGAGFTPVAVGNSADFAVGAAATSVSTSASGKAFTLAVGNVSSTGAATTISGRRVTGLMTTSAQVLAGQSAGGPVVNLSGQVVGIDLSGSAHGADVTSYAVPVNEALQVARQLKR
jgi:S1-C subfamily serine protease